MDMRYLSERASDVYDDIIFNTDKVFNEKPPKEWVSFMLGGIFALLSCIMWVFRYKKLTKAAPMSDCNVAMRAMLAAYVDNDSAKYTCCKLFSQSFFFLGGLQWNYEYTFIAMLAWFTFESFLDTFRVLLAFKQASSLTDLVLASKSMRRDLNARPTAKLSPTNVYEDISRDRYIVFMVFITQAVLISFVVVDIFESDTTSCRDGTPDCPVVGTLGSWFFYVLGIFMALVFMLGPKTNFGQSEQNPVYWLQLLISAKATGAKCTWLDKADGNHYERDLYPGDMRLWLRFFMSFLINGVGFHILVHALPIQVAAQSSFTGVVFRAVGMLYLVDLDDTPGNTLTIIEGVPETSTASERTDEIEGKGTMDTHDGAGDFAVKAQQILDDARAQLDSLAEEHGMAEVKTGGGGISMTGALAMAGGVPDPGARGVSMARGVFDGAGSTATGGTGDNGGTSGTGGNGGAVETA